MPPSADDQTVDRRATGAAVLGLAMQLTLGIAAALLGLWTDSTAIHTTAWYLLGGVPIWIVLILIYNQRRLERLEALEQQELEAGDARSATIFQEAGGQLDVARRRLERLTKWALPIVSAVVGLYLLIVGSASLWSAWGLIERTEGEPANFGPLVLASLRNGEANPLVILVITIGAAFLGFLVARYLAGMAQARPWSLLRGGASYLMGNVVVLAGIAIAAVLALAGLGWGFAVLAVAVPALMVLLGFEMLLGLVLGIYRPRRADEQPRPAFDSRLLGWLTRPESLGKIVADTLRYQFGFDMTGSWFYQLLGRSIAPLIALGLLVLVGISSLVVVDPQQQALVSTFGQLHADDAGEVEVLHPGLHVKWPWPISTVDRYDVHRVQTAIVGSGDEATTDTAVLWTNQHLEGSEEYLVTAPTELDGSARPAGDEGAGDGDAESTAGAGELAAVRLAVNWRIGDLPTFVRSAYRPQRVLQTLALQSLSRYTATHSIDELLGGDGEDLGVAVAEDLQAGLDQVAGGLGIDIVDVSVLSVHPPQDNEVAARFLDRASALQERETAIEQARTEAATTLAAVAGSRTQANRIVELNRRLTRLQRLEGELPAGGDETSLDPSQQQLLDELREQYPEPPLEEGQAGAGGSGSSDDARRVQAAIDESTLRLESLINEAGGEAAQLIAQARADAARTQLVAQSQAGEFPVQLEAYRAAPRVFVSREFYNMLRETLPELRKVVLLTDPASQPRVLELDLQTLSSGLNYTPGGDDQ